MKLTRRTATAGVCAAVAAGAVSVGGGSAVAAAPRAAEHHPVRTTEAGGPRTHGDDTARLPTDPWIAGRPAAFHPPAARRLAVFDPWVEDQPVMFPPATG
ncbi:hypothetical protein ACIF8T_31740 [Streptomyces sp. NPDC085946]|uniref:hypothetical protein n=1 Tax=Streptomyces sp. NPDC085946 TaxID=3365744 RepID=UPI0037D86117